MTETVNKPQLAARNRCTGCGACSNGCPKGAIRMVPDREGFLYPQVEEGCVLCGHCTHICPVLKQREPRTEPAVFAVWNRDDAARLAVKNAHELPRLRGAKPVQSDIGETYQQVRLYLDQGRQVLFSGTPCQVDGLYRYLGEHPERLVTCDVACSGVCSPGVWARLVSSMAYVKQHRPVAVEFCGKLSGDQERRFRVLFEGGGRYDAPAPKSELGRGLFLRPACYHCPYAGTDRTGDLTLANFAGGDLPVEEKRKGVSLLLINTAKGAQIFDVLPLHRQARTLEEAAACDAALRQPPTLTEERSKFFDALEQLPFQQVRTRYLSAVQHREGVGQRLRELLHRGGKEKKS